MVFHLHSHPHQAPPTPPIYWENNAPDWNEMRRFKATKKEKKEKKEMAENAPCKNLVSSSPPLNTSDTSH